MRLIFFAKKFWDEWRLSRVSRPIRTKDSLFGWVLDMAPTLLGAHCILFVKRLQLEWWLSRVSMTIRSKDTLLWWMAHPRIWPYLLQRIRYASYIVCTKNTESIGVCPVSLCPLEPKIPCLGGSWIWPQHSRVRVVYLLVNNYNSNGGCHMSLWPLEPKIPF